MEVCSLVIVHKVECVVFSKSERSFILVSCCCLSCAFRTLVFLGVFVTVFFLLVCKWDIARSHEAAIDCYLKTSLENVPYNKDKGYKGGAISLGLQRV